MRIFGQLTLLLGLLLIIVAAFLALWRQQGPSTAMFLVSSHFRPEAPRYALLQTRADGSDPSLLLTSAEAAIAPIWSPDGQTIYYTAFDQSYRASVWAYDVADRTTRPLLTTTYDIFPTAISPDGQTLAAIARPNQLRMIYLIDVQTATFQAVALANNEGTRPLFGADGTALYYGTTTSIVRLALPDGKPEADFPIATLYGFDRSPDGDWIAYFASDNGQTRLFRADLDGKNRVALTTANATTHAPAISPDGRWIVYSNSDNLYRVPASGGAPELIVGEADGAHLWPAWSPLYDLPFDPTPAIVAGLFSTLLGASLVILKGTHH